MRILIDTANTKQIKEMYDAGVICGATTNPTLIAKEGREFEETLQEIIQIFSDDPDTLIFAEAVSLESDKIIAEVHSFRIYTNPQLYHCNHGQKIPPTSVGGIFSFL